MKTNKIYDVIVIGGGPVGLYATFIAGYLKLNCLCLEADIILGGQPNKVYPNKYIYDFPGHEKISGSQLTNVLLKQVKRYEQYTQILTGIKIISYEIEKEGNICLIDDQLNRYLAKNVILTVGIGAFEPMKLENFVESHNHQKVRYCLESDETYNDKNVLILGGGDAAVDYAYHIKTHGKSKSVTIAHRRDSFRADGLSKEDLEKVGVEVLMSTTLVNWTEDYCLFNSLENENLKLEYDILLIQYGLKNLGSVIHTWSDFKKEKNKFIVDNNFETNVKGFYAAGSCIYRPERINMIITGMSEVTLIINHIRSLIPNEGKVGW